MIEELHSHFPLHQIANLYAEADRKLGADIDRETLEQLRAAARLVNSQWARRAASVPQVAATFDQQVRQFENALIRQALEEANGSVTRAARALGLTHQGLCYIINHRHQSLLSARKPIRVRRKSLIKKHK